MTVYTGKDDFYDIDEIIRQELTGGNYFTRYSRSRIVTVSVNGEKESYKFNKKNYEAFENMVLAGEFLNKQPTSDEITAFCEKYGYKKKKE